jgi:hypothetical protein
MSYWQTTNNSVLELDSLKFNSNKQKLLEFHELEPGIVLDIILDENHTFFTKSKSFQNTINVDYWPENINGSKPDKKDLDYTWIGKALIRLLFSTPSTTEEKLIWACPIEHGIVEYPLLNEVVMVYIYYGKYYYSRRINSLNIPNNSVDFGLNELIDGEKINIKEKQNLSETSYEDAYSKYGVAGKYFKINNKIRNLKKFEGDLVLESRFGQSIRFSTYDENRNNDIGDKKSADYNDQGGNPMILIRNRQRKILGETEKLSLHSSPNLATINGSIFEKNVGGHILENINHDGTSIHITSGKTISKWVTTCYKKMFGVSEEISAYNGKSNFTFPVLSGEQLIINTDRIILSSRYGEIFNYSKKRYSVVTDSEYTIDAHDQIVFTTHNKTVLNSPAIYLGEYDKTDEPILLGQTAINWMYDLCDWLLSHTHWHKHSHVDAGKPSPFQTQIPVQVQKLLELRNKLHTLLSRRVFVTGGGFSNGQNGYKIQNGSEPTQINVLTGAGVPGGWKGSNKR